MTLESHPEIHENPRLLLDQIREQLKSREGLVVAGEVSKLYRPILPLIHNDLVQHVFFFIAPQEPIRDIEEINDYAKSLITGIEPVEISVARQQYGHTCFCSLSFDEVLAICTEEIKNSTKVYDPETWKALGVEAYNTQEVREFQAFRKISVHVYPLPYLAHLIAAHERGVRDGNIKPVPELFSLVYYANTRSLETFEYGKNPFEKFAAILKEAGLLPQDADEAFSGHTF